MGWKGVEEGAGGVLCGSLHDTFGHVIPAMTGVSQKCMWRGVIRLDESAPRKKYDNLDLLPTPSRGDVT